jgi:hypothetical protein
MEKVVKFTNQDGSVGYLLVNPFCGLSIDEVAQKDSPEGSTWEIISSQDATFLRYMAARRVRAERAFLLGDVDAIATNALRWAALTAEQQQALAAYRQALLDVPQQSGFPHNVTWPAKPE